MSVIEMRRDIFRVIMVHSLGGSAERAAPGLEKAVRALSPDLVILNGDIVCGISAPDNFISAASLIARAAGATGAKFAVTFGDRDDKNGLSRADHPTPQREPHSSVSTTELPSVLPLTGITGLDAPAA